MNNNKHAWGKPLWNKIGSHPQHGICVPLFSLHTKNSCGIGEFLDLLPLIQWCKDQGFQMIQLLPLNDSGEDSSPYNCISSVALNPLYLSLSRLPHVLDVPSATSKLQAMQKLCAHPFVPYKQLRPLKWAFLYEYYVLNKTKGIFDKDSEFLKFCEKEQYWLRPYTVFRSIKKHLNGLPVQQWPKSFMHMEHFHQWAKDFEEDCRFFAFLQFLCFQQLSNVKAFADKQKIFLKGDIPILISRDSCDVWYFRQYFSSSSVGAPPDMYNAKGQNWELPTYNMKNLAKDNYLWWKTRVKYAEHFYSLYRLDHVAGFYRLWIWDPSGHGYFYPEKEEDFLTQGERVLTQLLRVSSMLPIGEDLGHVPLSIKKSLSRLGICGIRIPRWERIWPSSSKFIPFDQYTPLSVTTLSTHDSDTLAGWWEYSPKEAKQFAEFIGMKYSQKLSIEKHFEILKLSHQTSSIFHINLFNDYLPLCPQWVFKQPKYERINIPGTVSNTNWVYRVKPSLEELVVNQEFNTKISRLFSH